MSSRTRLLVLCVSAPVIAFAVVGGYLGRAMTRDDTYQHLRVFEDVVSLIMNNYVEDVDVDKVMRGAMRGLAEGLDPDTAYLSPSDVRTIERGEKPPAGEVGLDLTRQYYLRVIAPADNSPAARAGIRPGDFVRAIDGKATREMSVFEGMRLLRGEPGTKVTLTIIRGSAADPHQVELVRERPSGSDVSGKAMTAGVGYLRVAAFAPRVADEIRSQVGELSRQGAIRLVVDLRNDAHGDFDAALAAARLFVPSGTLAMRESRSAPREMFAAAPGDGSLTLPAVLVVNEGTSGPAEVFAAALAGNKRAELVGERTHGRAALQKLVRLPDGSGLWLSNSWFLTPAGAAIQEKGLTPVLEVEEPDVEFGAAPPQTDPLLDKALERLGAKPQPAGAGPSR
jgi:carboxyl-terminal processing protease